MHFICPHLLSVPRGSHAYAEAGQVYQLVVMQKKIIVSDNLISRRIHDPNYTLASFNQLFINEMLDNHSYGCLLVICHTCGRTSFLFVLCILLMYLLH